MGQGDIVTHFVPSLDMVFNYMEGVGRRTLPDQCLASGGFASTWWDDTAVGSLMKIRMLFDKCVVPQPPPRLQHSASFAQPSTDAHASASAPGLPRTASHAEPLHTLARGSPRFARRLPLPASCNLASLTSGAGCKVEMPVTDIGITLQVAADRCPGTPWPYVSVSCTGPNCAAIGRPCTAVGGSAGCGEAGNTLVCTDPVAEAGAGSAQEGLVKLVKAMTLIDSDADLNSCGAAGSGTSSGQAELARQVRPRAGRSRGRHRSMPR